MFGLTPYDNRRCPAATRRPRDLFESFFGDNLFAEFGNRMSAGFPAFKSDIRDAGGEYIIEAELPGVPKENVKLSMEDGVLTISAEKKSEGAEEKGSFVRRERQFGSFSRSFRVDDIDCDAIKAEFDSGLLKVTLPKLDPPAATKRMIDIA